MRIYINLKDEVALNTKDADHLVCAYCHLPIALLPDRSNRMDCEDDHLVSYHIWCYDMAVMERLSATTMALMVRLIQQYGMI